MLIISELLGTQLGTNAQTGTSLVRYITVFLGDTQRQPLFT